MAIASAAQSRFDRDYTAWFIISAICSPLLGIIFLFVSGSNGKKCTECSEVVKLTAKTCKHCGFKLKDDKQDQLDLVDKVLAEEKSNFWKDRE